MMAKSLEGNENATTEPGGKRLGGCTGKGFMPGQSGNPEGMKPGTISLTRKIQNFLQQEAKDGKTWGDILAEMAVRWGIEGKAEFFKIVLERTEGKVTEKHDHDGEVRVRIVYGDTLGVPGQNTPST